MTYAHKNSNYLAGFRFKLEIDGYSAGEFRVVSGLGNKTDVIEYKRGGDRAVRRMPGRPSWNNITLEHGFSSNEALWKWRQEIIQGEDDRRNCTIVVLDADLNETMRYNLFEAWPVSWEGPQFNATSSETAIEKVELAVEDVRWE